MGRKCRRTSTLRHLPQIGLIFAQNSIQKERTFAQELNTHIAYEIRCNHLPRVKL